MNLLVTNTRNAQAYAIIRALRAHARKIVVTMYGQTRLAARLSHAANSRLVDRSYYVPSPVEDWRAGHIREENTDREDAYVKAVLEICEAEQIDTIFPSWDPKVYVFAKNKPRFEERGILLPVPDYETVLLALDKYRTIQVAREVGSPCPRTHLPKGEEDLKRIAEELGFPLVIKSRFTSGGRGLAIVTEFPELVAKTRLGKKHSGMPLIQEYIPGSEEQALYLVIDKNGELTVTCVSRTHRSLLRLTQNFPTAREAIAPTPYLARATSLLRKLGWWAGTTINIKIDARDGTPKLMEINPRLGSRLWELTSLPANVPLIVLKIARGEEVQAVPAARSGAVSVDPVEDLLGLGFRLLDLLVYKFRVSLRGETPIDPQNPPIRPGEMLRSYAQTYLGGQEKVFSPYFTHFFQDPRVSLLWWASFLMTALRAMKQLGR